MADQPRPVDPQLAGEASDFRAQFNALCDGGTSSPDLGLLALEVDNVGLALAFGQRGLEGTIHRLTATGGTHERNHD